MDRDREYWDRHAQKYGTSMRALGGPIPQMCALVTQELAGAGRVLEVGAGTGLVTAAIAKVARHVVATDYSEAMLGVLRANIERAGFSNVEYLRRDIYALDLRPQSFDAVVCANVLHLVPDLAGAIAALRAVLRPEGKLVAPTFCHAETWFSLALSRVLALTGFPAHRRFTSVSLREELEHAGLRVTRQEAIPGVIPIGFVSGVFA